MKDPTGTPCKECPWRRKAAPGWLGPETADEWVNQAHGEVIIACHLTIHDDVEPDDMTQCSGAAIYRSNVCKVPRFGGARLPANRKTVFANRQQFLEHHQGAKS